MTVTATSTSFADESLRHFQVYEIPEVGLVVYKPGSPEWTIELDERTGDDVVLLTTPQYYFPPTSIEIRLSKDFEIEGKDFDALASVVADTLRRKTKALSQRNRGLESIKYGKITALIDEFDVTFQNQDLTIQHAIGKTPSGAIITMMATTPKAQMEAIEFMLAKIYSNLKEI